MSMTFESTAAAQANDLSPPKNVFVGPPSPPPQPPVVIASLADKEIFGEDIQKEIENFVAPRTQVPEDYVPAVKTVDEIFKEDTHCSDNYASIIGDDEVVGVEGFKGELVRIDNWDDAGLPESLLNNIKRAQYLKPREIQKTVIPLILDSYDVIGHAETGSGKTAAYLIPIIAECILAKTEQKYKPDRGYPYALIIAPTRELVRQCTEQSLKLADGTGVQVAKAYGEYPSRKNIDEIYNGCDILIATPGRFKHFVEKDIIRFAKLRFLVFDEGDHLLTQNFADDVRPILHLPSFPKGNARQTLFFSATFTDGMLLNAKEFMREDAYVLVSNHKNAVNKRCVQEFVAPEPYKKFAVLVDFLKGELAKVNNDVKKFPRTMVFCNTREYCEKLTIALSYSGITTKPLNSMRAQDLREQAFDEFRANEISVLIVTDVLARGIDIKELDLVINFDMPYDFETYIHRVGRTGRVREGRAISYVDRSPRRLKLLEQIKQSCEQAGHIVPKSLEDILSVEPDRAAADEAPPSADDNATTTTTASGSEDSLQEDMKKMDIAAATPDLKSQQLDSIKEEEDVKEEEE